MSIYNHTAGDRTPYTYLIEWTSLGIRYYGVRFAKNCSPADLWVKYFSSSKHVSRFRKENGEPDRVEVRHIFENKEDALVWEQKVLRRLRVNINPKYLNKSIGLGSGYFDVTGTKQSTDHVRKRMESKSGYRHTTETRQKLSKRSKGKVTVKNSCGEILRVDKTDPRYLSGELVSHACGMLGVIDTDGNRTYVNNNDPRYLSGELVALSKGRQSKQKKPIPEWLLLEKEEVAEVIRQYDIPKNLRGGGGLWFIRSEDGSRGMRVHPLLFEHYYKGKGFILAKRKKAIH